MDEISRIKGREVIERTVEDLDRIGIINSDKVILRGYIAVQIRLRDYDIEYRERLNVIEGYLRDIGIINTGRFGSWEYANMDAVVRMSRQCAMNLQISRHHY